MSRNRGDADRLNDYLARLRAFAERHLDDDGDAAWLLSACQAHANGARLEIALGSRPGFSVRHAGRLTRRDALLRQLYRHRHAPCSLNAAAQVIAADLARFRRVVFPQWQARGIHPPLIPEPGDWNGFLFALCAIEADNLQPRTIREVLAKRSALPSANAGPAVSSDAA